MENVIDLNEKKYVEKVLREYQKEEKEIKKLDELRNLSKKVKRGPQIFAYVFGTIGSLVLGSGMSVAMEVIFPELFIYGIIVGIIGIIMVTINYFIYQAMIKKNKKRYGPKILELSKTLLNE